MNIKSQRISLSPLDKTDFALFVEISMCPDMMKYVCEPFTYEDAKAAFEVKSQPWNSESNGWYSLGITEISTGEKLGNIGLKVINHDAKIAEVGFMIKQGAQRQGFAKEALTLLKHYAFIELGLNKLVAICSTENTGSYKLLEAMCFSCEGCLRQNAFSYGKWNDDYTYGFCKSDS